VDLSCWKAAPCGAERVRPETLERFAKRFAPYGFRPEAFLPGYGLAESTLIATASKPNTLPRIATHSQCGRLVSSGSPLPGVSLRIADPASGKTLAPGEIGEIRVKGPCVSRGYWRHPEATMETFGTDGELRTGDLGFLQENHLYVSGRIKDLIIINGSNHAPDDIEAAAISCAAEITAAAAFASGSNEPETVTLALEASGLPDIQRATLCENVRRGIATSLEVPLHRVVLVRSGLLPRTTSGKVRRAACREALSNGTLKLLHDDHADITPSEPDEKVLSVILAAVAEVTGRDGARPEDNVINIGMGSLDATRLAALLRSRTGRDVSLADLFAVGSFARLAVALVSKTPADTGFPAIVPGSGRHANILTHAQERMWFLHQFDPASAAYHVFGALELTGPLSSSDLNRAFQAVVSRHDILRSRHGATNGTPHVSIDTAALPSVELYQMDDENAVARFLPRFARTPFNLAVDSPIRAALVTCRGDRHILAICVHHIVADGWSLRILARELADCYASFHASRETPPARDETSYLDYAVRHREWVDSGAVDSQIGYWKNRLAGHSGILKLPTDFPRPRRPSSLGGVIVRKLPAELCNPIALIAKSHRATPFMVHLAAFLLLLRQHGAGLDPVIAIPVANRNQAAAATLIGTLVNTLPFRLTMDPDETFPSLLGRVRDACFEMLENQDAPFEKIIEAVKPDRASDHAPLAQVMFDHQEIPVAENWAGGLACRPFLTHRGAAQFDLSLLLTVFSNHQQLAIEYRSDLFLADTAATMLDRHLATLEFVCRDPECRVIPAIGLMDADREWLARVSNGPERPRFPLLTTHALFGARAAMHPARTAVTAAGETHDYQELGLRSDRLARALRRHGVRPGDRIAVLLERDRDLPAALLAIWKAGAAYVPLDRANPAARLHLVLADQAPLHILASTQLAGLLPPGTSAILLDERVMTDDAATELPAVTPADPAYVIYTSGSTGKPKGVVVSHGALANFLLSMAETPGFTEADRLLAVTTVSFDISTLEIFLPLVTGGSLELVSTADACDGHALLERLDSSSATVMQATPATWRLLLDAGWQGSPDLKILCGGEALDLALATTLVRKGCQLWNLYGPTETTVWSTHWRVPEDPQRIRIGRPIANTGAHVVSQDGSLLPPGVPGELWISGDGLAEGYWKRPDLTDERFVSLVIPGHRHVRAYRTGDIARWHADGTLECLGRADGQVKIRGFRVETGEIEAVLSSHPQVEQAVVALRGTTPASEKLVAWITLTAGGTAPDAAALREFLAERLPVYMLPADIGVVDSFPLTSSGKLDASQLRNPESCARPPVALTVTERQLIAIWNELLDCPSCHPDDNWFQIGGHSLLALRLFARIHQEFKCRLPLSVILDHPSPRGLASIIDQTLVENR
jgi:amino acid adenylation domain-containing protein